MKLTWLRYAILTLFAWGLMPEIRRLIDWKTGLYQPVELASVIPILMLVPFAYYAVRGGWQRAHPVTRGFATIWLAAYGYAFVVGILTDAPPLAVAYEFATTCAPVAIGIWLSNELAENERSARTIVATLLILGTISSAYAVAQHISPFPWDAMWIYSTGYAAAGFPYPFSMRAWGTMNSPGPFGDYLVCTILLSLPLVDIRRPLALMGVVICCIGLAVTFVRADTFVLAGAALAYLALSPRRVPVALGIGSIALVLALGMGFGPTLFGEAGTRIVDRLTDRFNTIDTLDTDVSVVERQNEIRDGIDAGIANPLGLGLGVVGPASKLDSSTKGEAIPIDSGYISRFDALGYLGMLGYLTVTVGALALSVRNVIACSTRGENERAIVVASAAAVQAALVAIDFAVDSHAAFDGILFWLSIAIAFGYRATNDRPANESDVVPYFAETSPAS